MLSGTGDLLYPYDLALTAGADDSEADLATSFGDKSKVTLRTDDPYLAARRVLIELMLNPRDPSIETIRDGLNDGGERFDEVGGAGFGVTIDRLSRKSVGRLTAAYVGLLGARVEPDSSRRIHDDEVQRAIGWLWIQTNGRDVESVFSYARNHDPDGLKALGRVRAVLDAIGILELSPLEIERARSALLGRIKPELMPMDVLVDWFSQESEALAGR